MFEKPMFRILWWSLFTLIADVTAIKGLYSGQVNGLVIVGATMVSIGLLYLLASYKVDGPSSLQQSNDERLKSISLSARSKAFYVLILSVWALAFLVNLPSLIFLKQHISVILGSIALIGFLVNLLSFIWYKYQV